MYFDLLFRNAGLGALDATGITPAPRARKMIAHRFTGPPTRAAVARVGVVERWVGVKRESSPPGTAQDSILEFAPS